LRADNSHEGARFQRIETPPEGLDTAQRLLDQRRPEGLDTAQRLLDQRRPEGLDTAQRLLDQRRPEGLDTAQDFDTPQTATQSKRLLDPRLLNPRHARVE
jgi:hypothetical protein